MGKLGSLFLELNNHVISGRHWSSALHEAHTHSIYDELELESAEVEECGVDNSVQCWQTAAPVLFVLSCTLTYAVLDNSFIGGPLGRRLVRASLTMTTPLHASDTTRAPLQRARNSPRL